MKCQFCGKTTKVGYTGPNDIVLCEECNKAYEINKTEEEVPMGEVIEMNQTTEQETQAPVENPVRCEIVLGVLKDGRLYFNVSGDGADLLTLDGLLQYAERRMKQQWDIRDMEVAAAQQKAEQEKAAQETNE